MLFSPFSFQASFSIGPFKLVADLFLGYKGVNEFVDKVIEEALKKERGKGGDAYECV